MDVEQLKDRTRAAWGLGNYPALAAILEPASRALVDACAVSAGQEVLDVAAGNGNLALLAAREGASVVALDLSPGMVELGRARTAAEGVDVEWVEGDAEQLPFDAGCFDCAGSVFGAMFAPRPERVAAELFRVVRAGGTVAMANWRRGGFSAGVTELQSKYSPPPEGVPSSILWGDEDVVRERFEGLAARVEFEHLTVPYRFDSPEAGVEFFEGSAPNMAAARETMPPERYEELRRDLLDLIREFAPHGAVEIDSEYLLVVARKRG
jgi:SAM-dependent methyltransferase